MSHPPNKSSIPINITTFSPSAMSSSVSPTPPSTSSSSSFRNVLFHELQITIESAKLTSKETTLSKQPDAYVELCVDDSPVHRTECEQSTYSPNWNQRFPVLITPHSKLTFKVYHRNSLNSSAINNSVCTTKDFLIGSYNINLFETLKKQNGKIDNMSMQLMLERTIGGNATDDRDQDLEKTTSLLKLDDDHQSDEAAQIIDLEKPNYLHVKLTGLEIDMSQYECPKTGSSLPNVIKSTPADTSSLSGDKNKNKSNDKHSTRSLPRLFRGSKNHASSSSSTKNSNNVNVSPSNESDNNAPKTSATASDQNEHNSSNVTNNSAFQSTLPRWSLNDPNSNSSYPRQQVSIASPSTSQQGLISPSNAIVQYNNSTPSGQYPFPTSNFQSTHSNNGTQTTTFTITNNSNQVQPATITTTEYHHEKLPPGVEIRYDCYNRKYYIDHNTKSTSWELPQQMDSLPLGWEIRRDGRGRVYFVDHNTRSTTWQRPTAENMRNYQHWQRQQSQVMQQCDQRFLYPTHSNNNQACGVNSNSAQGVQYQMLTQQNLNPQQMPAFQMKPTTNQSSATASSNAMSSNQVEHDENNSALGPLPDAWELRFDQNGRPYFVNHKNKVTQWQDPRTQGQELIEMPLSPNLEVRMNLDGTKIFVDRNNHTTTSHDPRLSGPKGAYGVPTTNERSFRNKLTQFRYLCHYNALPSHIKINVSRSNVFEDSFLQIMRVPPHELRRRLFITFRGEEGLDYGGISREWFFLVSHQCLNPLYCLFEYAGKNNYSLQINPASSVNPDHLWYFSFVGRFIAMALFHGKFIYSGFTLPFYKRMLGKTLIMKDIETIDPEFYNSLVWFKENNIEECGLEVYFTVDFEVLGKLTSHELKEGGSEIRVDESNKQEYLRLMSDWRFSRGQEEQTKAFLDGFNEVLPLEWLKYFDERELELLLCGMQEIDIDDWQRNTIYRHYTRNSKQILWFWQFVKEIDSEKRARLLQFVTGTCRVPVGGFAELMGSNGPQRFCIERVGKDNWLPRSHTCFNRLDLPPYKNYEQLVEKLSLAIEETEGFSQE